MSNNESDNALIQMVKYILDQNINMTMEKSPLAKAGVKVTPSDKYSREQSFEALETFVKGLLQWLDMHNMLGPNAYKYQVPFLGMRLEGKALEWFNKTVEPRKYQGTPMDLEQVVTGLYSQYIPSLDDNVLSNTRRKPRNNGSDRTKSHTDPPKLSEISKGPSITPGPSGVNRNLLAAPGGAGPPIHNRQQTNHEPSHNSIECYNCRKSGHIKPNCPEPLRARCIGAVHVEDSPAGQVDNADLDINDNIDDECPDEDEYHNNDYNNQLDLSEGQCSWGSKPIRYSHNLVRIAAVVPIGPVNARKTKIAKEGEPLYDHTVKMKTTRLAQSKHDLLTITGYFLVGEFVQATGLHMHKLPEPIGIQQAFQGSRAKLYYTITMDITIGQNSIPKMGQGQHRLNGLGSIVINGEMIDNDLLVWLASEETKVHGMLTNKVTLQEEKPLEPIVEQLSIRMKEKFFKTVRNELLVVPVPQTWEALKTLISLVAYMLLYCGHLKQPLNMLQHIYMDKPYVCNEEVYNVIVDINSALDTDTNVVKYYDDIMIKDGYLVHHKDNSDSMKATVHKSDHNMSLNDLN
ncbi:hypothetical protein M422DRAFT_272084 [Sphaerobolus stellatus SS14]|uniref:Unplaced genomic scaffold SPHSTscaffold_281, whole genome shotgun sequence n=1 Tax=Sphaerobolus stellatus (strain SS14) TaxID=990650 RepID=A0A0C9UMV5_SPHS4|nr:hypothetical protein M422DRAFT_272084 [Sphaerobolus stellatus SS14]